MFNADTENLLLIVVGTHLRAEDADRPLAYHLQQAIVEFLEDNADLINCDIVPTVCSDLWYLNHTELHTRPTLSVGGPGVNALSAYFAQHLPVEVADDEPKIILQLDPEFTDLRICIWGANHQLTAHGLQLFIADYLEKYLTAVVNQVEPKID